MISKQFQIVEFHSPEYINLLKREAWPYGGNSSPIERTLDSLFPAPLACRTVVFESDYVDMDYQDEFAAYYSKAFKDYKQRCCRLHFFSSTIPESKQPDFAPYKDSYLGFIVIRPIDLHRMGRTILRPTVTNP